jgi:hypothetical protein
VGRDRFVSPAATRSTKSANLSFFSAWKTFVEYELPTTNLSR